MKKQSPSDPLIPRKMLTRRRLLKRAAGVTVAAAAQALMPFNVRRVLAQGPPKQGSLNDIKHVVLLMQENRSFDHYFGTLAGVQGIQRPEGASSFRTVDPSFTSRTRRIPTDTFCLFISTRAPAARRKFLRRATPGPCSTRPGIGGQMDLWLPAHRKADGVKGPYAWGTTSGPIFLSSLRWRSRSRFAMTITARCWARLGRTGCVWMTGTIDPEGEAVGPIINNKAPPGGYTWTTYPERLDSKPESAGRSTSRRTITAATCSRISKSSSRRPGGSSLHSQGMLQRPGRPRLNTTRSTTNCPPSPGSFRPAFSPSIPTTCPRMELPSWPAKSMRSRRIRTCGQRLFSS